MYSQTLNEIVANERVEFSIIKRVSQLLSVESLFYFMEEEKKKFEYQNKLEWCPQFPGFSAYILVLDNGDRYKGFTSNFKNRMLAHFNGYGGNTTRRHKPLYILHHEEYESKDTALAREKFFKSIDGYNWIKSFSFLKTIRP